MLGYESIFGLVKDLGPAGIGIFAGYLITEKAYALFKNRRNGGSSLRDGIILNMYETLIEMKTEMETQTGILKKLVKDD